MTLLEFYILGIIEEAANQYDLKNPDSYMDAESCQIYSFIGSKKYELFQLGWSARVCFSQNNDFKIEA